jgi:hypothetical protein
MEAVRIGVPAMRAGRAIRPKEAFQMLSGSGFIGIDAR